MNNILDESINIKDWLISVRRDLHSTPELGLEEFITKDKIIKYLKEINIDYKTFENHTGIVAYINTPNATKTIAIRADIDALPITELNDLNYKSLFNGKMHACGHDAHTAILLGTCKLLNKMKDKLSVNLKFFFQPAEETVGGAKLLIKDNCMKNPNVDYMLGLHVQPYLESGQVEIQYGTMNASTDTINITVKGKQGHGAYPHLGIDAIVVASNIITNLQTIVSRNIDPTDSIVLSLGTINGGTKANIICNEVKINGTLRTLNPKTRIFAKSRIEDIVKYTCMAYNADGFVEIEEGYSPLVNDNSVVDIVKNSAVNLFGKDNVFIREKASLGAEDFSFFLENSKGAFYHLGCGNKSKNITSGLHTANFNIDENCLALGVALHIKNIFNLSNI